MFCFNFQVQNYSVKNNQINYNWHLVDRLENPMDRKAWQAVQSMESQELDMTWQLNHHHCPSLHGKQMGTQCKQQQTLFFWAQKSLQMVTAVMKLKTLAPWKKSYDEPRQHIKKQGHHFANRDLSSQSYNFPNSQVWM